MGRQVRVGLVMAMMAFGAVTPRAAASTAAPPPSPDAQAAAADAFANAPLPPDLANARLSTLPAVAAAPVTAPPNTVSAFGSALDANPGGSVPAVASLVSMARTPDGKGYWLLAADGGVFAYGDAAFMGSLAPQHLGPIAAAIVATPDGGGYWIATTDGRLFTYGDALYTGTIIGGISAPIVSMVATPDGKGYWLATNDGRIFTFGDALYTGAIAGGVSAPIVGMATTPDGKGYWLATSDGRVFSFGDAQFAGAVAGGVPAPIVGIARTADGGGYWLLAADGGIRTFGNAVARGSFGGSAVAIATTADGTGYWIEYGVPTATVGPFNADALAFLATRGDSATAAVFDATTGRTYLYQPGVHKHTASIVKVDIMATLFTEVAAAHRSLTSTELSLLTPMIDFSNNAAASALWREVGNGPGVAAFNTNIPMSSTFMGPDGLWGLTFTTALDQVNLVRTFAYPNHILSDADRGRGLSLMENVTPVQRWGVSGGVPPGVTVALKNGWSPLNGHGWITNSIGFVQGQGRNYVIAVLTEDNPSMAYGIDTIQGLASLVWQNPAGG